MRWCEARFSEYILLSIEPPPPLKMSTKIFTLNPSHYVQMTHYFPIKCERESTYLPERF